MLKDELLQVRYVRYLDRLIELSEKEIFRTRFQPKYRGLALMYNRVLAETKKISYRFIKKTSSPRFQGFSGQRTP